MNPIITGDKTPRPANAPAPETDLGAALLRIKGEAMKAPIDPVKYLMSGKPFPPELAAHVTYQGKEYRFQVTLCNVGKAKGLQLSIKTMNTEDLFPADLIPPSELCNVACDVVFGLPEERKQPVQDVSGMSHFASSSRTFMNFIRE